jgi:hypothetical protein
VNTSSTHGLPGMNSLLLVDVGEVNAELAAGVASRVEGHPAGDVLIAAPGFTGDLHAVVEGLQVLLRWFGPRGVHSLATELVEVRRAQLTTWRVRPVGPVLITQRRDFARAALHTPIALVPVVAEVVLVTTGSLVELGEGGLRARVNGQPLIIGTEVIARLELEGVPIGFEGNVLRSALVDGTAEIHEVVVLIAAGRNGERIRRVVLHQQMLARRRGVS